MASEIESRFSRINASLLESTVTMTRGLFLFAAVGLAVFFCVRTLFLLLFTAGDCYCPHIEARTNTMTMKRYWKLTDRNTPTWETRGNVIWNTDIDCESLLTADDLSEGPDSEECDEFGQPIEKP